MPPPILVSIEAGVQTITLNRPERLNAFNAEMHGHLRAALERAEDDGSVRAVLLTGAGRGFCAGQDLAERDLSGDEAIDLSVTLESLYNPLVRRMRALPKPIVCAVNGVAAGAGANVALACDLVLAARSASFIQAFARIGLVPDSGGTWFLPRLAGRARATGPTRAYGLIKRALEASGTNSLDAQLDLERDLQREIGLGEDYREGVAAFLEKRKPAFKGT